MQPPTSGNVYNILEGNKQYVIPVYQRIYTWDATDCNRLWNDIVKMHTQGKQSHFIGTIVNITERQTPIGVQKYMIIDGQQRLTTLTLLLLALRDYANIHSECGIISDQIQESYIVNKHEADQDKYKLLLTQTDRDVLIRIVDKIPIPENLKSRVIDNYNLFMGKIMGGELSPKDIRCAIGCLQLVSITLEREHDDAQAIFESLNSTGVKLDGADLIRNYLLMKLPPEEQKNVYDTLWHPTEKLFDYEHQSDSLNRFFRDYLTMKLGRIPREAEIYMEFRSFHADGNIRKICEEIYQYAKYYTDMYFVRSNDSVLQGLYGDMNAIRMDVAYPFLLKVHSDYSSGLISLEQLREIVSLCISYVLRRAVCDIPTNSLNKTFATMKNSIKPDDYLNSVKAFFILLDTYKEFPSDKRFLESFLTRDIYGMSRCRYILSQLEKWGNKSVVSLNNLTIEHIVPAEHKGGKLPSYWQKMLGDDWENVWSQYVNTIGNLTLTAYNSEMSDSSFLDKLNMEGGFKESALRLNKNVVTQITWGKEQIRERAAILGDVAKKIWKYPSLSAEELAPYRKIEEEEQQYSLETYDNLNALNRMLFEKLNLRIMNLGTSVRREFKKLYIAYKTDTNFVDVVIQKSRLRISVNMKFSEVVDPNGLCRDITGLGRWGNGDVELSLDGLDGLDAVMEIIKQSFDVHEDA